MTAPCSNCGQQFEPTEHQLKSSSWINCPACKNCPACGDMRPAGPKPHGLPLCKRCRTIAWQSCWRKRVYPQDPGEQIHDDGMPVHPYRCAVCGKWHLTKIEAGADLGQDYTRRAAAIGRYFTRVGFDIDAHRVRT